jgi:hypothetical protein
MRVTFEELGIFFETGLYPLALLRLVAVIQRYSTYPNALRLARHILTFTSTE